MNEFYIVVKVTGTRRQMGDLRKVIHAKEMPEGVGVGSIVLGDDRPVTYYGTSMARPFGAIKDVYDSEMAIMKRQAAILLAREEQK